MELEASTGAIRLAPPIRSNVNLEAKVGVSVTDGKNEARSNFQVKRSQTHGHKWFRILIQLFIRTRRFILCRGLELRLLT